MTHPVDPASPRFSIVLPTHNRADVLPFAIRSALWQTDPNFELLVAGDGCTDQTAEIVAAFDDPRMRWFDLPKAPGIGYANRNAVLRQARGRLIAYLAHDDLWFPDHLQLLGSLLEERGAPFAYSRGLAVGVDGTMLPYWFNMEVPRHRRELARGRSAITMSTVVHERSCLDRFGYWDETLRYSGDKELWHRMIGGEAANRLAFLPQPTALHFVANWRNSPGYRLGSDIIRVLARGILAEVPSELRLPADPARTQQEVAWQRLHDHSQERVQAIRGAVAAFQDAILWNDDRMPGLVGINVGRWLGNGMAGLRRGLRFTFSAGWRAKTRNLRARLTAAKTMRGEK